MLPVILLAFWLGARGLDTRPLWNDEAYSIYSAGGGPYGPLTLAGVWERVATEDPWQAPGYSLALHVWISLVGYEPPALRALSLLLGMLAVAWTYRLGVDLAGGRVGLYAAIILATSVMFVHYLHEMRVYALLTLATVATIWLYWRIVRLCRPPRWYEWLALLAGMVLLLYLHYFSGFTLAMLGVYHLLLAPRRAAWSRMFLVFAAAGALFLPWLRAFLAGLELLRVEVGLQDAALPNERLVGLLAVLFANGVPLLLLTFVLVAWGNRRPLRTLVFWIAGIAALILTANAVLSIIPASRLRYLLLLWPLLAILVALGIAAPRRWAWARRWLPSVLLVAWAGAGIANAANPALTATLGGSKHIYPMQHITRVLRVAAERNDLLVNFLPVADDFDINYRSSVFYFEPLPGDWLLIRPDASANRWQERAAVPDDLLEGRRRVWVSAMPGREPDTLPPFQSHLEASDYALCDVTQRSDLWLALYTQPAACCAPSHMQHTLVEYGGLIRLSSVDGLPAEVDDQLTLTLGWALSPDTPLHVYSASLHILDAAGEKVAQQDYGLDPRPHICHTSEIDTHALPPGDYAVRAAVYAWETGDRLPASTPDGATGDLLPVGMFTVSR